jgi:DNA helicase IV
MMTKSERVARGPLFAARPRRERKRNSLVDVRLGADQRDAIALPVGQALLVLGEAGHGKTTVALRRLAAVWHSLARAPGARPSAAVVVPTEGLARLLQPLLRRLGVDVEARTYDAWSRSQVRRAFDHLPRRETDSSPPSVQRLKRDPALRVALAELALRPPGRIDDDEDEALLSSRRLVSRGDLQHLFGDRLLLESVMRASNAVRAIDVAHVLEHTRLAFGLRAEDEFAHVFDRQRLKAVDGRPLDEGTSSATAGCLDVEDYAVLFELDRLRASHLGLPATLPRRYSVLLVDEAQEFAPLELALIGRSLAPEGTLIVAGDGDQHLDPSSTFLGWDGAMHELGARRWISVQLDVGYRCPPPVADLAKAVLAPWALSRRTALRTRGHADVVGFVSERELAQRLGTELRSLRGQDRRGSVAVVCRSPQNAGRIARALMAYVPLRLVLGGRFLPRGAVEVTTVDEVRGLEFDYVVIPDATDVDYPDSPAARRALYVAITRARYQVVVAYAGAKSAIVPASTS